MAKVKTEKSLKEQLLAEERLFQETGHMYGLKELKLKEQAPVTYEIVYDNLLAGAAAAFRTAAGISFSPFMREAADAIFALMTPTGDVVFTSIGVVAHTLLPGESIKWAIREGVEEDPGIEPGDIFEQNSPMIATVHVNDVHDIIPIFWEGELVAWASGMTHRLDVGSFVYGSLSGAHDNYFADGLQFLFEKIGRQDQLSREFRKRVQTFTRMPHTWLSDTAACVAGAMLLRERVIETIRKYSVDYFKQVMREYIEDGRRSSQARIRTQLVPGRYRKRAQKAINLAGKQSLFPHQQKDWMVLLPTELLIDKNGDINWSYHGASRSLPLGVNSAAQLNKILGTTVLISMISYEKNNSGSLSVLKLAEPPPPGSWANPHAVDRWASCENWNMAMQLLGSACGLLGRGFYARGYVEESFAGGPYMCGLEWAGINAAGMWVSLVCQEQMGAGLGAQPIRDGPDIAGMQLTPLSDMGNVEIFELLYPMIWLGRRISVDGMGKGKYRGGTNPNAVYMMAYADGYYMRTAIGAVCHMPGNDGVFGAYPEAVSTGLRLDAEEIKHRIEQRLPLVHGRGEPLNPDYAKLGFQNVKLETAPMLVPQPLPQYGVVDSDSGGSPGMGDPIERDPEMVKKDLELGVVSQWSAREIWGVEAGYNAGRREWVIDSAATQRRRQQIIDWRKKRGMPFKEWWRRERRKVIAQENMTEGVLEMLRTSMQLSPRYDKEVREFWSLPADFSFQEMMSNVRI